MLHVLLTSRESQLTKQNVLFYETKFCINQRKLNKEEMSPVYSISYRRHVSKAISLNAHLKVYVFFYRDHKFEIIWSY